MDTTMDDTKAFLPTSHQIVEQLIEETRYPWEYAKCMPHVNHIDLDAVPLSGTVWYSRHAGAGAFIGSFRYKTEDELTFVLHDYAHGRDSTDYQGDSKFSVHLSQPNSFQLASDFIRKVWNSQQPNRKPIDGPEGGR